MKNGPFILVQDNEFHWYVIPFVKYSEWSEWQNSAEQYKEKTDNNQ